MPEAGPIPQNPQKSIKAKMHLATFVGDVSSKTGIAAFNKEVEAFLETVDNVSRLINGRNAYSVGEKRICIQIWYLETIKPEPVVEPIGKKGNGKNKS